ncbi:MAG: glycosyltransferase family 4 protein [Cytophagales bacterium]
MKVLLLHQHYHSPEKGGAIRSYYLTQALVAKGIKVTVITTHNEQSYLKRNDEGVEIHFLPIAYNNRFTFAARIVSFLQFIWRASRLGGQLGKFDFCYAISVPLTVGIAAMLIKRRTGIPFIFEVGDLWPEAPIQMGVVRNTLFQKSLYALENRIYQSAHSIVALSPAIKQEIEKKVSQKKIHLIPNMADCEFFVPQSKPSHADYAGIDAAKFTVAYIGAIGIANGLDYFLECANTVRKVQLPVQFLLMGDGAELDRLKNAKEKLVLTNLLFLEFGNRERVKQVLSYVDACFVCYKNISVLQTGSPNKYFDALAAGKLVLTNFGGWIKTEIESEKCGVALDAHHPSDFIKKISPFISDQNLLRSYQSNARALAKKKYSRELLSDQFVRVFSTL